MRFTKMQGAGNDYVYMDCFSQPQPSDPAALSRALSQRHTGVGGDGLILLLPSVAADLRMEIYNADGSRAAMCGNGLRCAARYAWDRGLSKHDPLRVETPAGLRTAERVGPDRVRVHMGPPKLQPREIPVLADGDRFVARRLYAAGDALTATALSVGNPHCVVFDRMEDFKRLAPVLERHPVFPDWVNVEFAVQTGEGVFEARVFERGSGETQACGTGACAVLAAAVLEGRCGREAVIRLPGGALEVCWREELYLTGDANFVFDGEIHTNFCIQRSIQP